MSTYALGLHVMDPGAEALAERYMRAVKPGMMKWLTTALNRRQFQIAREVGAEVHLRHVYSRDEQQLGSDGARALRHILRLGRENPEVTHLEAFNEWHVGGTNPNDKEERRRFVRHGELMMDFMRWCEDQGQKASIFSFGTGCPETWAWELVEDVIDYAGRHGHTVSMHEYAKPVMQIDAGRNTRRPDGSWETQDPATDFANQEGWNTGRFVKHIREWRRLRLVEPGVRISESGTDDVANHPAQGKGFRDFINHPLTRLHGSYAKQQVWYAKWRAKWGVRAVDFGFNAADRESWESFDLTLALATLEELEREMANLQTGSTLPMPTQPPRFDKIAWATEEAARILKREGMIKEHDYIVANYVKDAIAKREAARPNQ